MGYINMENKNVEEVDLKQNDEINEMTVKFFLKEKEIEIDKVNRMSRRLLVGQANRYRKKYSNIIGPNGERPSIIIKIQNLGSPKAEVSLQYPESMSKLIPNHDKATRIE